jgi:hypothetical protein
MSILELDDDTLQIETVRCSDAELTVTLQDGRRITVPLWWLSRLHHASPEQRAGWRNALRRRHRVGRDRRARERQGPAAR